jgi:hypothetical protein
VNLTNVFMIFLILELDPAIFTESTLTFCMCKEENVVEVLSSANVGLCSLLQL